MVERIAYDEFSYFHENAEEYGIPYDGPPSVRREFVEVGPGRRLSALVWGDAPPELVLLHGGAQNAHTWDTVALALGRPLVAIDLPGHGHSDGGISGSLNVGANAEDVAVAVRALAPTPIPVVGMSLGGMTALALTDLHPELVVAVSSDLTRRVATPDGVRIADRTEQLAAWRAALLRTRDQLAAEGATLGAILDNPRMPADPLVCMEDDGDLDACTPTRHDALRRVRLHIENERRALGPAATLDTASLSCDDERCRIWQDGAYVYADSTHLSADFTEAHVDDVVAFLERLRQLGDDSQFAAQAPGRETGGP